MAFAPNSGSAGRAFLMTGKLEMQPIRVVLVLMAVVVIFSTIACMQRVASVKAGARAWVWVAPTAQPKLIADVREFAVTRSLEFTCTNVPASWSMIGIILLTPGGDQIQFLNSTKKDKFSASIVEFNTKENWRSYWNDFKMYMATRYEWRDADERGRIIGSDTKAQEPQSSPPAKTQTRSPLSAEAFDAELKQGCA